MKKAVLVFSVAISLTTLTNCTDLSKELQERKELENKNSIPDEFEINQIDKDDIELPDDRD